MKPFQVLILPVMLAMLIMSNAAVADEIWLKNGNHLQGSVASMEGEKLVFKTTFAGDISVAWPEITDMRTDASIKVVFSDGTSAQGRIISGGDGKITLESQELESPLTFQLSQVKAINPPPLVKLSGRVNIGINITDGNTNTRTFYGEAELVSRTEKNRFTIGGRYNRAEDSGDTTVDNQQGYMKYDHFLTDKWYFLVNASGTKDSFQDLNLRTTVGAGLGYQFFESKTINLALELGASYVNKDYIVAEDDSYAAGRWAVDFDYLLYQDFIQFFHKHVGLAGLSDISKTSIESETGFRFKIYQGLNATAQVNYDWNNDPAPGVENSDTTYIFTLGYQF